MTKQEIAFTYANEADLLNMALFGKTAKQFKAETRKTGNLRDYASVEQLIVLVNFDGMNAELIRQGVSAQDRLRQLRSVAYYQLNSLAKSDAAKRLESKGII